MPSGIPSTSELLTASLQVLGIRNTRGASKLDKVLSAYNKLSDALNECRNEVGPIAHGKDGFLDTLYSNQLRSFLLIGDTLVALILAAFEGTEPNLQYTREPYEAFGQLHKRIDNSAFIQADIDNEEEIPVFVLTIKTQELLDGIPLRVRPSELLYALDRVAFIEVLASSVSVMEDLHEEKITKMETDSAPIAAVVTAGTDPSSRYTASYNGILGFLRADFATYLKTLSLEPEATLNNPVARLTDSLLETAEYHMGIDWRNREVLQFAMKVSLRRVLSRFGISVADAKEYAKHIFSWLRIQNANDFINNGEASSG